MRAAWLELDVTSHGLPEDTVALLGSPPPSNPVLSDIANFLNLDLFILYVC